MNRKVDRQVGQAQDLLRQEDGKSMHNDPYAAGVAAFRQLDRRPGKAFHEFPVQAGGQDDIPRRPRLGQHDLIPPGPIRRAGADKGRGPNDISAILVVE